MNRFEFYINPNETDRFVAIYNPKSNRYDVGFMKDDWFNRVVDCSVEMIRLSLGNGTWTMISANTNEDALFLLEDE